MYLSFVTLKTLLLLLLYVILAKLDVNKEFDFSGIICLCIVVKKSNDNFLVSTSLMETWKDRSFSLSGLQTSDRIWLPN